MTDSRLDKRSRFGTSLAQALANRGRELLEARDLAERVPALDPLEAYFIVKELGVDDATPILRHCSDEQIQAFVDLDCWDGDQPSAEDIDAWLAPFAAEGPLALAGAFVQLDDELQIWYLAHVLEVLDARDEDPPPPPRGVTRKTTPDTFFLVAPVPGPSWEVPPVHLVECLYARDLEETFRLLTSVRSALPSSLEELSFQFRSARVESLGFPSRDAARSIFAAPLERAREPFDVPATAGAGRLPAIYASSMWQASLLTRALGRIEDADLLALLQDSLQHLINHAIVACGNSPRDLRHATEIAGRVRDTVSLGLERLLSPDGPLADPESEAHAEAAEELLRRWTLFDLFRKGHAAVRAVQDQARALVEDEAIERWRTAPVDEDQDYGPERRGRELLNALLEEPPLYGGFDPVAPARRRAFATQRELETAYSELDAIAERFK